MRGGGGREEDTEAQDAKPRAFSSPITLANVSSPSDLACRAVLPWDTCESEGGRKGGGHAGREKRDRGSE